MWHDAPQALLHPQAVARKHRMVVRVRVVRKEPRLPHSCCVGGRHEAEGWEINLRHHVVSHVVATGLAQRHQEPLDAPHAYGEVAIRVIQVLQQHLQHVTKHKNEEEALVAGIVTTVPNIVGWVSEIVGWVS